MTAEPPLRGRASGFRPLRAPAVACALLGAGALLLAPACQPRPKASPQDYSVVLVTLDTTRADRIGAFGGTVVPTPHLDAAAREGVCFQDAISQVPLTLPAHATILTGRHPAAHGVRHNGIFKLRDAEETLAERLGDAGFQTAAFVAAYVLNGGFGLEQGFDVYSDIPRERFQGGHDQLLEAERSGDEVNKSVFSWLDHRPPGRLFLWVHYFDPHLPYSAPETPGRTLSGAGYDREISYMDAVFGDLMARLRRDGLLDKALLVVVGDHGEGLGEHREQSHGIFLYESALHVPLFLRAPGLLPQGKDSDGPVELVDLAPTVLDLLGLPPLAQAQGVSLVPRLKGRASGRGALAYAETLMPRLEFGWSELRMVRDHRYKYIAAPRPELYDLERDPRELDNLVAREATRAKDMADRLEAWIARTANPTGEREARRAISAEDEERLRSLGYLGGDAYKDDAGSADRRRADPKDVIDEAVKVYEARDFILKGQPDRGLPLLDAVLALNPNNHLARNSRVQALVALKRYEEAELDALAAVASAAGDPDASRALLQKARRMLASVLWMRGKNREAEEQYRLALGTITRDESAPVTPGLLLGAAGGTDEARRIVQDVLTRNPDDPMALAARFELEQARGDKAAALKTAQELARVAGGDPDTLVKAGELARDAEQVQLAVRLFQIAHDKSKNDADILGQLGTARLSAGDIAGAEQVLLEARRLRPKDPRAPFYLGNIALLQGDEQRARAYLKEALDNDPRFTPPLLNLALWLAEKGRLDEAEAAVKEALGRRPGDEQAQDALRKLEAARRARPG